MIGVAVVGAGRWGPNLIANFRASQRSRVLWVVDRDAQRLAQVKERFPEVELGADASLCLADPAVDAIVIATPANSHYELARAALEAGKHVLVEKPVTDSLETAEALVALAARTPRVLLVGHVFVYHPAAQRVKRYLADDALGRIFYVSMVRTNLGPIRVDVNCAWDLAAHDVALANYWLDAEPHSVAAVGGSWINPSIEDAVFATLRYPGEVLVHLHASWLHPRKSREITVVGQRRMLTFDDMQLTEPIRLYDKQVSDEREHFVESFASFRMSVRDGDILIPRVPGGEPLRNECEHFLDCIESGRPPLTGGAEGTAVVRALEALTRSLANGGREERLRS